MDFLSKRPFFSLLPPRFLEKTPVPSPTLSLTVSSSAQPYARTDTPLRIAHSASSQFLPSPFTFTRKSLIQCVLRVKKRAFFRLHPVKETGVKSSPASRCSIDSYSRKVKRRRQKTKNSGRARYACVLGAEEGGRCIFAKGFPVVDASLQMSDEPYF